MSIIAEYLAVQDAVLRSASRFLLLCVVREAGADGVTLKQAAQRLGVTVAGISYLYRALEDARLVRVVRTPAPSPRSGSILPREKVTLFAA